MGNTDNTETEQTTDALLEDILNELDITFEDMQTKKKIADIMQRGKGMLTRLCGKEVDYSKDMLARELLFSYCRYGRSNAIEQFEHDFSSQLTAFALEAAVAEQPESGAADEETV